jgi:hypothetical protein
MFGGEGFTGYDKDYLTLIKRQTEALEKIAQVLEDISKVLHTEASESSNRHWIEGK